LGFEIVIDTQQPSRQCMGWGAEARKSESAPEPVVGSGIMPRKACPLGSMKGN